MNKLRNLVDPFKKVEIGDLPHEEQAQILREAQILQEEIEAMADNKPEENVEVPDVGVPADLADPINAKSAVVPAPVSNSPGSPDYAPLDAAGPVVQPIVVEMS